MMLTDFLHSHKLDRTLLLGFYGGGNYGDELLMEVLAGLLKQQGTQQVTIAFQHPETYKIFHHNFGYPRVDPLDKIALLKTILRKKHIIVGGGGLWGMDANLRIVVMSLLLFVSRWLLGKKVFLLGVGYYNSSTKAGRVGAWLAAKAANIIVARDAETYDNFARLNKHTHRDVDIAWYIDELDLQPYTTDVAALEHRIHINDTAGKTIFMTLRQFRDSSQQHLTDVVSEYLAHSAGKPVIVALMEPQHADPEGYQQLEAWQQTYPNIQIVDFSYNPLGLFLFFRKYHEKLIFVGPQFHAILSAYLTGVPFLPLAYDNKVHNLLQVITPEVTPFTVQSVRTVDVRQFIDNAYEACKDTAAATT